VADLTASARDRGQVILVAAFALAVTLVALALVLNSAIYTENLATRTESGGATEALSYRSAVQDNVGAILERANDDETGSRSAIESDVRGGVADYDTFSAQQLARSGRIATLAYAGETNGRRVWQSTAGTFTNTTGAENWTVASDVDNTRRFRIEITDTGALATKGSAGDEFRVNATDPATGEEWWLNVTTTGGGSDLFVGVRNGTGRAGCTVGYGSEPVWVNVTAGTVAGQRCEALTFAEDVDDGYEIGYENATEIRGTYSLTIDSAGASDVGDAPDDASVIYAVFVDLVYETPELEYETTVRVAPGESDA